MPASQPLPGALRTLTRSSLGRSRTPLAPTARPVRRAAPTLLGTTPAASRCLSSRPPARRPLLLPPPLPRTAAAAAAARHYHPTTTSAQQPPISTTTTTTTPPFSATEAAILAAAYAHVPAHGFTARALALGARDAGYPPRARELSPTAAAVTQDEVNARAEALAWERLLLNTPVIGRWQEAQAIMAQPTFAPECISALAALADDVWALAGDAAVDPTWYAKRAALSAVYASAELYMTADRSEGFRETREFLRRRFAETAELGRAAQSVGQWLGFTAAAGLNVLRSKGVNI
ncbi:hypothetical protein GGTG_05232 [Gaeumannomyces tritici R3-111a-1]|uniref:Ubiquinone biosynthesis protein n=1 Tax=Gaeumannomyces tritici (strain R3-111a-1) TaxID=644352 RepID=J3NVB9_GAET3|nr:hypothetical protein GGTG_05232 [Gaeumannomyces tritici R3-111a-1]EJT75295.1 hypothetical protein GGTG_05232 [Gaeumannomyces tritici R3-111a-1]